MAQRRYTCTNQSNSNARPFTLAISRFSVSGDTTSTVATINSLKVTHYHTATGGKSHQWTCWVVVTFNNGNTITSDQVTHHTGEDKNYCPAWVNTFSNVSAANVQSGIASIEIQATPNSGSYSLYWRATSSYPVTIDLDFGTYVPIAPTITTASFGGGLIYRNVTSPVFTHVENCDSHGSIVSRTLRLYNSSGFDVTASIPASSPTTLNPVDAVGSLSWVYTVIDSYGQKVTATGTITVYTYYPPDITVFTAERVSGDNTSAKLKVSAISNSGYLSTVRILMWADGSTTKSYVLNLTNRTSNNYQNNNLIVSGLSANSRYYFELTVSDGIQNTVQRQVLNGTSALFSIEKNGVAVGKLASRGTTIIPNFEVAMPSFFTEPASFTGLTTFSDIQYPPRSTATLTITKSGFSHWSWSGNLRVSRIGPYVYMYGGVVSTTDVPYEADGYYYIGQIASLGSVYLPNSYVGFTQLVDGTDICIKIEVRTDGSIILRSNKASGPFPSGYGFFMTGSWIAAASFSS